MENTRIVSFLGMERGDFPFYLSLELESKKYRTLTIDNSCNHDLFLSLKRSDDEVDYLEHGRNVYMRNRTIEGDDTGAFSKFDVVIIFHGYNVDYKLLEMSDCVFLMMDYFPSTTRCIDEVINIPYLNEIPREKFFVLFRDKLGNKVTEKYLLRSLCLTGVENEIVCNMEEADQNAYQNFCYNGFQKTKYLSSEMKAALTLVRVAVVGTDRKKKKKEDKKEEATA